MMVCWGLRLCCWELCCESEVIVLGGKLGRSSGRLELCFFGVEKAKLIDRGIDEQREILRCQQSFCKQKNEDILLTKDSIRSQTT